MSDLRPRIVVASGLSLVGETVRAALSSRGYDCPGVSWPVRRVLSADGGLLIFDPVSEAQLAEVRNLVGRSDCAWLLLSGAPPGPFWGAALRAGVVGVIPDSSNLAEVDAALRLVLAGEPLHDLRRRAQWISEWHALQARRSAVARQAATLTPRERAVTRLMCRGEGVREMSEKLEVSEATVRSHVKAVLRKLRVSSQLDAVATVALLPEGSASIRP